jgi:acetyl esterase/lipase
MSFMPIVNILQSGARKIWLEAQEAKALLLPMPPRPIDLVNRTISLAGLRVIRNIPFGLHPRQKLDIYAPARAVNLPLLTVPTITLPVIVFFHGGSWQHGQRRDYLFAAATLAKQGFVVAVPDYRLHPEVQFPAFLQDCAMVTAWVFRNIHHHGGDDEAVFLMGHSAGAYNAAMLALDATYLNGAELDPARLSGWIGLAGPYDFLPSHDPVIAKIFSGPGGEQLTQPVHFVHEGAPPALLLHGGRDRVVLPRNTAILAARMREAGNAVETRIYPRLGHTGILTACLPWLKWRGTLLNDVTQFIAACRAGEFADAGSDISAPMLR